MNTPAQDATEGTPSSPTARAPKPGPTPKPAPDSAPEPVPMPRWEICPYCGEQSATLQKCSACGGRFDALSRQTSQNHMGPWQIRSEAQPYRPGCSAHTLKRLIERGTVRRDTVIRGPGTHQFWMRADKAPGVAHLLGVCHACGEGARAEAFSCDACGVAFRIDQDRQHLGLMPTRLLPGDAAPRVVASHPGTLHGARARSDASEASPDHAETTATAGGRTASDVDRGHDPSGVVAPNSHRRMRALRRQNTVLLAACVILCVSLVLVVAALVSQPVGNGTESAGGESAAADGRSMPTAGRDSLVDNVGNNTDDYPNGSRVARAGGVPTESPLGSDSGVDQTPGATSEPEPATIDRVLALLRTGRMQDRRAAVQLLRDLQATADSGPPGTDPEGADAMTPEQIEAILAMLGRHSGREAFRRLP